jgi:hypothetical protein
MLFWSQLWPVFFKGQRFALVTTDEWRQLKNEDNSYEWVELNQYFRREH